MWRIKEWGIRNEELLRKPNAEPSSLELCWTDGAARGEPSSLELSRVATEEDEVKVKPAIDEVNEI